MRRPRNAVAFIPHSQAEVHVVEGNLQLLIEATHRFKSIPAHHKAGGGHGGIIANTDERVEVSPAAAWKVLVGVAGDPLDAEHHACMLDPAVRVIKLGASDSHSGNMAEFEHGPH